MVRKIANRLVKEDGLEYLDKAKGIHFEEVMLKGLMIGNLKLDINSILKQVEFNNLDDETFNKTIQKIRESFRIEKAEKENLNKLKRKKV